MLVESSHFVVRYAPRHHVRGETIGARPMPAALETFNHIRRIVIVEKLLSG